MPSQGMKKQYAIIFILAISIVIGGCSESNDPPSTPMITPSTTVINAGGQVGLTAMATDPDGDMITYDWQATGGSFPTTSGNAVFWVAPTVAGTYTITVNAKDSQGTSSGISVNSVNIVVSAGGGGGTIVDPGGGGTIVDPGGGGTVTPQDIEVVIGDKSDDMWPPFLSGQRNYGLTQYLYYANEIGMAGKIKKIATMPSTTSEKIYTNLKISLTMVNRNELSSTLSDNYDGGNKSIVHTSNSANYGGAANKGLWREFALTTPFDYDGSSNLLVEFEMNGDAADRHSVGSYAFSANSGSRRHITVAQVGKDTSIANLGAIHLKLTFEGQ